MSDAEDLRDIEVEVAVSKAAKAAFDGASFTRMNRAMYCAGFRDAYRLCWERFNLAARDATGEVEDSASIKPFQRGE